MKRITVNIICGIAFCLNVIALLCAQALAQTESTASKELVGKKEAPRDVKAQAQSIETKQIRFGKSIFKRSEKIINWNITTYDIQGRLVEAISFKSNGKPDGKTVQSYDDRGNLTERVNYDSGNIVTVRVNYKYDMHGRLLEELWYQPGYAHIANGDYHKKIYKYDDQNRLAETLHYDGQNQLVLRSLNTYNSDGAIKEEVCENPVRGYAICPAGKRVYKYDSSGNQIEQGQYNVNGKYTGSLFRKYNEQGKQIEFEIPGIIRVVSFYDPNGFEIESETYSHDGRISTKSKYDSKSGEIMRTGLRPDGVLEKEYYVKEFDVYGNLLKKTWWRKTIPSGSSVPLSEWLKEEKDKGTMVEIIEHKITYYK